MQRDMEPDLELNFVSGRIFDLQDLPKAQKYLYKYFDSYEQRLFVKYFLMYGCHDRFVQRTGVRFRTRWRQYLMRKIKTLEAAHDSAKDDGDIELLAVIEGGKMKVVIK